MLIAFSVVHHFEVIFFLNVETIHKLSLLDFSNNLLAQIKVLFDIISASVLENQNSIAFCCKISVMK